ncbi:MAG: LysR family transcriptional regulator [Pseudomonadota bacterium]
MDIRTLRLVQRVAALGGLSRAARDLGMSPATASARLGALEAELGHRLFHRSTRVVVPTPDGERLLPYFEAAVDAVDQGVATLGGADAPIRGTLRMTAPGSFGRKYLIEPLAAFSALHPALDLDLRFSDEVLDIARGAFDLIIRDAALADSTLIARKLAVDRRLVVASPDYVAQWGAPQTPDGLRDHRAIVLGADDRWKFASGHSVRVRAAMRVNDGEAALLAAEAGLGVAIQSTWNASDALKAGRLRAVLDEHPLAGGHAIWAIYPASRVIAPKLRSIVDFLAAEFAGPPSWDQGLALASLDGH